MNLKDIVFRKPKKSTVIKTLPWIIWLTLFVLQISLSIAPPNGVPDPPG